MDVMPNWGVHCGVYAVLGHQKPGVVPFGTVGLDMAVAACGAAAA